MRIEDQEVFCDLLSFHHDFFSTADLKVSADDTVQPDDYGEAFEVETNVFDVD